MHGFPRQGNNNVLNELIDLRGITFPIKHNIDWQSPSELRKIEDMDLWVDCRQHLSHENKRGKLTFSTGSLPYGFTLDCALHVREHIFCHEYGESFCFHSINEDFSEEVSAAMERGGKITPED